MLQVVGKLVGGKKGGALADSVQSLVDVNRVKAFWGMKAKVVKQKRAEAARAVNDSDAGCPVFRN